MQHPPIMIPPRHSRRSFLKVSSALAGGAAMFAASLLKAQSGDAKGPLIAYVGTYTSPLQNMRSTQVDLPPGNGRGIHLFQVERATGAMTPWKSACHLPSTARGPTTLPRPLRSGRG